MSQASDVRPEEGGKRGRRIMTLTEAGEKALGDEWTNSLDPRREMESVLRSATVALCEPELRNGAKYAGCELFPRGEKAEGFPSASAAGPNRTPRSEANAFTTRSPTLGDISFGVSAP